MIFRYEGSTQLALGGQTHAAFPIIDSGNFTISYCHLSEILVTLNSYVTAGNKIGVTGNTGRSTGEHLHLKCTYKGEIINPVVLFRFIRAY